ncbi:nucleoside-diphosphate sugar epimerase [Paenibacillus abyssi]|uniref:Nucleoside-diphosphate sugar epimerase n=1 Tax=Paenibacillus abyssi TaxID=1340531 RepID=A0A917FSR8_9BACL|nr:nucleoside-diphosphate sugar epimerase [Paenibacillus abyssi]GGF98819.1 hypothetical protein GCM10010916_15120 [Paenibacillus abyssi]
MQHLVNEIVEHLSKSHQQLARVLEAERHVVVRMANNVHALPDHNPDFNGVAGLLENSQFVTKSIVGYLNSLAELEEAIADNLSHIIRELDHDEEE